LSDTQNYYQKLIPLYRKLHSPQGAMHFPLYNIGNFKGHHQALQAQAYLANTYFNTNSFADYNNQNSILELGCGQGYNCIWLAKQNPRAKFTGLDITPKNIEIAQNNAVQRKLQNIKFVSGNFEALPFENQSFTGLLAVEALCHAFHPEKVLAEAHRVLNKNCCLVVFDGYTTKSHQQITNNELTAVKLLSVAFAAPTFKHEAEWIEAAKKNGFELVKNSNFSGAVLPGLTAFERGWQKWISPYPFLAGLSYKLGGYMGLTMRHLMAGALAAQLIKQNIICYKLLVFKK
nr:class I SAM-dependent methyltransferase [Chitinophagales bacterium]